MFPTVDLSDDLIRVCGPDEGFWVLIVLGEEPVDGGLEIDDRMEDTPFQTLFCELGEEALEGVEPGRRGRREVKVEPGMALQVDIDGPELLSELFPEVIGFSCVSETLEHRSYGRATRWARCI